MDTEANPEDVETRLNACLPMLIEAADDWQNRGMRDAPLLIGISTPRAGLVITAEQWPDNADDGGFTREAITAALMAAVEAPASDANCDIAVAAVSLLIGGDGRIAHLEDVARLRAEDQIPMLLCMVADPETVVFTTSGVASRSAPSDATLH